VKEESLLRFYRGNRLIGKSYPIAVIIGDTTYRQGPYGEHYVFHSVPGVPFLYQRIRVDTGSGINSIDLDDFGDVFSAQALLRNQLAAARDQFEFMISQKDRALQLHYFCSSSPFEFCEIKEHPFAQFKIFGNFTPELKTMFEFTACRSLIANYPTISWIKEPKN
jgi:hypothetical protein